MIYLIRHGERADDGVQHDRDSIILDFDPHLTKRGMQEADLTGIYLKNQFIKDGIKGAIIISSPFIRCVQTASGVAQHIDQHKIYTASGLGEFYKENWFKKDILEELTVYQSPSYDEVPFDQIRQHYPETLHDFFGRFSENYKRVRDFFFRLKKDNFALVIITHGFTLLRQIGVGIHAVMNLEKQFDYMRRVDYCSINVFQYEEIIDKKGITKLKSKLVTKNYTDHLNLVQPKL